MDRSPFSGASARKRRRFSINRHEKSARWMELCHTTDTHSEIFRRPRRNSRALYAGLYEFFFSDGIISEQQGGVKRYLWEKGKICIYMIMRAGFAGREGRGRRKNILPKSCEICCNRTKAISLQIRQKIALGLSLWVYARDAICGRGFKKGFGGGDSRQGGDAGFRPSAAGRAGECGRFPSTRGR